MLVVSEYSEEFPEEVRKMIKAIDSERRYAILGCLRKEGDLSFTQISDKLAIKKNSLTYHLKELMKGAIVANYSKDEFGSPYDSYYSITSLGNSFIKALFEPFRMPQYLRAEREVRSQEGALQTWLKSKTPSIDASTGLEAVQNAAV